MTDNVIFVAASRFVAPVVAYDVVYTPPPTGLLIDAAENPVGGIILQLCTFTELGHSLFIIQNSFILEEDVFEVNDSHSCHAVPAADSSGYPATLVHSYAGRKHRREQECGRPVRVLPQKSV